MVTLEKLVEDQKYTGDSDIQIIKAFFDLNDMEEEAMDLITELSKIKVEKLKRKERMVKEWTSYLPSKYLYENYDLEIADRLHTLELDYLSHGGELSGSRLEWARENIPNIELPKYYFNPLIEWLDERGIRFKGEKPIENKRFI
ncbi:MAG: hypothetical protein IJA10_10985 [Lachnospiraceae bacterium]|nr:hypothetical protein [Lachnospiraceae bacterium]